MALTRSLIRISSIGSRALVQESSVFRVSRVICGCPAASRLESNLSPTGTRWTGFRQIHEDRPKVDSKVPISDDLGTKKQEKENEKNEELNLTQVQRLKKVFAEYGSTAVVFHVCISLTSLGICYTAVKSGLDVPAMLQKIGLSQGIVDSAVTKGASTFVIAYACHKVFAPVRMFMTITCTPLIVRRLRIMGILKAPIKPTS